MPSEWKHLDSEHRPCGREEILRLRLRMTRSCVAVGDRHQAYHRLVAGHVRAISSRRGSLPCPWRVETHDLEWSQVQLGM